MESTHPKLPPEILGHIIDEVALLDGAVKPTLKACSQTSKVFLNPSQRYLFRFVYLGSRYGRISGKIQSLHQTLTTTPALSSYIRILQINDDSADNIVVFDPLLPDLLSKLQNITNLQLHVYDFGDSRGGRLSTWIRFPHSLQQALIGTLASPSLVSLLIRGVRDLPQVVADCITFIPTVHLRMITFQANSSTCSNSSHPSVQVTATRRLRRLSMYLLDYKLSSPLVGAMIARGIQLEELTCNKRSDGQIAATMLRGHGNSLTKFIYRPLMSFEDFDIVLNILPRLQIIKFTADFENFPQPLHHVIRILETALEENEIKEIRLGIKFTEFSQISSYPDEWKAIDVLVSGPKFKFSQIHILKFGSRSVIGMPNEDVLEILDSVIKEMLPIAHEKGLFQQR
ncbi:hypothetical protein BDQ17DRAFT_1355674 [Cyathus striatus]|nr:hypothetical protein BDQ17DRAFT_1355674 [Cyathus striatus]